MQVGEKRGGKRKEERHGRCSPCPSVAQMIFLDSSKLSSYNSQAIKFADPMKIWQQG